MGSPSKGREERLRAKEAQGQLCRVIICEGCGEACQVCVTFHRGARLPEAGERRLPGLAFRSRGGAAGPGKAPRAPPRRQFPRSSVAQLRTCGGDQRAMAWWRWLVACSALLLCAASVEEEGARRALQFAMNEYNRASNDKYASRVAEVVRVRKQIVSGVLYFFDVKVGRTTCPKSVADVENCAFHEAPELAKVCSRNKDIALQC
uniref:Cystatin C n=1 Tax=Podarcis muralis TaxID=64176 RepID=A0A670K893_PODMU